MKKVVKKIKPKEDSKCKDCPAYCCHDLAMMISRPQNASEADALRWYLMYDTVNIFIRTHRWYVLIKGKCIYLDENNLCRVYDERTRRCKAHNPPECEKYGHYHDILLKTPEDLDKYLHKKVRKPKLRPNRKRKMSEK